MSIKRLWKRFSRYTRERASNEYGYCVCVTCGSCAPWKKMDAGHFVKREFLPTLFDERNVHPQCYICNRMKDGNIKAYEHFLKSKYGVGICDELWDKALNGEHPDLEEIKQNLKRHGY